MLRYVFLVTPVYILASTVYTIKMLQEILVSYINHSGTLRCKLSTSQSMYSFSTMTDKTSFSTLFLIIK